MTYRALLMGNSVFEADAGLNPLNAPTKDVARLHRALVDSSTGLFADEHVRLAIERSSHDLLDELDTFFSAAHRDDLLLVYYSGHGLLDERNQLFLCGRNTRSDRLLRTAVSNVRINEFIDQSVARCTVIILDCCSSGMFKGGDVAAPLAGPGRYVVSSTRGAALANDADVATGTSLFTEHLVTGLLGGAEDRDGDGYLDLREIFDYVRARLTSTTKQIPHCRFDGDAAVMLARWSAAPIPAGAASAARVGNLTFVLSENTVTLRDVGPDERLNPEIIEIYPLADAKVDCTAETDATWLHAEVGGGRLTIKLHPRPGQNRGKILVRDRRSGTAQVVRVHVTVDRRRPADLRPIAADPTATTPRPPTPSPSVADRPTRVSARVPMPRAIDPPDPSDLPDVNDTPDEDPGGGRLRKRGFIAIAAGVLLMTTAVGLLGLLDDPPPITTTPVPALVGLTRAGAEAVLREAGLSPSVVSASPGTACTPGAVIAQNPPAGRSAGRGMQIGITVCGVPSPTTATPKTTGATSSAKGVVVPELGGTRKSTESALRRVGLFAKFKERNSSEPEGRVIGSNPRSGTRVPARSTVTVFVSVVVLEKPCRVPDVTGETGEIAESLLNEAQLNSQTQGEPSEEPVGTVLSQSERGGENVKCGTTVLLSVSTGQETTKPDVGTGG